MIGLGHVDAVQARRSARGRGRRARSEATSTTVIPARPLHLVLLRAAAPGPRCRDRARRRRRRRVAPAAVSPCPSSASFARSPSVRFRTTSSTTSGFQAITSAKKRSYARVEVRPPPWNCRTSTSGFSRASSAVTMGTKAEGDAQCRPIVKEWPMTATRCVGQRADPRHERGHVRLHQQLVRQHAVVAQVQVLLAPVPDLAPRDLPLRGARAHRRRAGLPSSCLAHGEEVGVAAGQAELARRTPAGRGRCRSGTAPAAGRRRAPPRGWSGRGWRSRAGARGRAPGASAARYSREDAHGQRRREREAGGQQRLEVARGIEGRTARRRPTPSPSRDRWRGAPSGALPARRARRRTARSRSRRDRPCPTSRASLTWNACVPAMFASTSCSSAGVGARAAGAARSSGAGGIARRPGRATRCRRTS